MTASAGPVLKKLYRQYGEQVEFVTLYVREAHPGELFPQPESFEQKMDFARVYKTRDQIPWPVAVDHLEGELHQLLDSKPNSAYLMDTQGNVAFRSLWSNDERALRKGIEGFLTPGKGAMVQAETKIVPLLRGTGKMYDLLSFSGKEAKRDVRRQAPPIYAMARLAALFRPLPPLGRSLVAMGVTMVLMGAIGAGLRRLIR
jgi:hypothetical protein